MRYCCLRGMVVAATPYPGMSTECGASQQRLNGSFIQDVMMRSSFFDLKTLVNFFSPSRIVFSVLLRSMNLHPKRLLLKTVRLSRLRTTGSSLRRRTKASQTKGEDWSTYFGGDLNSFASLTNSFFGIENRVHSRYLSRVRRLLWSSPIAILF